MDQRAADAAPSRDTEQDAVRVFWRRYMAGVVGLSLFAAVFGQFFLSLQFAPNIWEAVINRTLAIGVVALFLERAIEVYVSSWRRLGEQELNDRIDEAREDAPHDARRIRRLERLLTHYKSQTQRVTFLVGLFFGVLIACTGMRVLDGLVVIDDSLRVNPYWQTRVWWAVDVILTGGVIGGGAAGIHDVVNTLRAGQILTRR